MRRGNPRWWWWRRPPSAACHCHPSTARRRSRSGWRDGSCRPYDGDRDGSRVAVETVLVRGDSTQHMGTVRHALRVPGQHEGRSRDRRPHRHTIHVELHRRDADWGRGDRAQGDHGVHRRTRSGALQLHGGGVDEVLAVVTRTTGEVPVWPVASLIWAASQWFPFGTVVVSQDR